MSIQIDLADHGRKIRVVDTEKGRMVVFEHPYTHGKPGNQVGDKEFTVVIELIAKALEQVQAP